MRCLDPSLPTLECNRTEVRIIDRQPHWVHLQLTHAPPNLIVVKHPMVGHSILLLECLLAMDAQEAKPFVGVHCILGLPVCALRT